MPEQHPARSILWRLKPQESYLSLFFLIAITGTQLSSYSLKYIYVHCQNLHFDSIWVILSLSVLAMFCIIYLIAQSRSIYLVDFACYKPDNACKCTKKTLIDMSSSWGTFTEESLEFQKRVLERSGLGENTYVPQTILRTPCNPCYTESRKEIEVLMFGAINDLFSKTDVRPEDIGILVVNCGLFSPTPSLSARVVNKYKLRSNIMSYNLGGMGCGAGVISVDLAKNLLQTQKNTCALVVSVEAGSTNWYFGNERSMLVSNCIFRIGGAAVLLSNKRSDKRRSKYQLAHVVRTHQGANDKSLNCATVTEDSEGKIGISLSKDLIGVAGDALKTNMTALGPLVLPLSEKMLYLASLVAKRVFNMNKLKPYVPDFKLAFEHFCVHAGGRAVLDGVHKNLGLTDWHMEPSRMTLYRFGNTSSTSIWYELAYNEAKGRVKRGLRNVNPTKEKNPWTDEIHLFPVDFPQ